MSFKLQLDGSVWTVSRGVRVVAEIHLDYWHQVDDVVLYADASPAAQLSVLRLAASHVQQYIKHRTTTAFGGMMVAEYRDSSLTAVDSRRCMDFRLIPEETQKFDRDTIVAQLKRLDIDVIVAVHRTASEALQAVIAQVGRPGLQCRRMVHCSFSENEIKLRFTVAKPNHFIFWKSEWKPGTSDLHIVPGYHPVMNGGEAVGMVNGDTDYYIRGAAVRRIYCPKAARTVHGRSFSSSWAHVKHPFCAVGRSFSVTIVTTQIRSQEGVNELVELLQGALGEGKRYVEISGGFRAPMKCAHNRLLETGKPSPYPRASRDGRGHVARGSEEHCVWAYRTLEKEGTLKQARVPDWFICEGWLGIYKGAEVRPTLF